MNGSSTSVSSFIYAPGKNTPENSLQKLKTHDHFGNLIYFSGNSHMLVNAYLFSTWVNWLSIR